jgi:hypothetical protein
VPIELGKGFKMALSIQQAVISMQQQPAPKQRLTLPKIVLVSSAFIGMLGLSACQSVPTTTATKMPAPTAATATTTSVTTSTVSQAPVINEDDYIDIDEDDYIDIDEDTTVYVDADRYTDEDDYPIEPYIAPEQVSTPSPTIEQPSVSTANNPIIAPAQTQPPIPPSHTDLLERARQNSKQQSSKPAANKSELPAFRNLMQNGTNQLKTGNLSAAESSFTRAQRLAPRSSAVYFYLSQVALKKNQPRKAEAMARRGLSVSQDTSRRRALWQLILRSGQQQNNQRVIREAQQALR